MGYTYYVPIASNPKSKKGISLAKNFKEDVSNLNASWYYDWGWGNKTHLDDPNFVPMLWNGFIDKNIPTTYSGYILHLNEPENKGQANKTPQDGFTLYKTAKDYYKNAKIVTCGVGSLSEYWGWTHWLEEFLDLFYKSNYPIPEYFHFHGYMEKFRKIDEQWNMTLDNVLTLWSRELFLVNPSKVWITEYGDPWGDMDAIKTMTNYCIQKPQIERYAIFTNRISNYPQTWEYPASWPKPPVMQLIDTSGSPTIVGQYYKEA